MNACKTAFAMLLGVAFSLDLIANDKINTKNNNTINQILFDNLYKKDNTSSQILINYQTNFYDKSYNENKNINNPHNKSKTITSNHYNEHRTSIDEYCYEPKTTTTELYNKHKDITKTYNKFKPTTTNPKVITTKYNNEHKGIANHHNKHQSITNKRNEPKTITSEYHNKSKTITSNHYNKHKTIKEHNNNSKTTTSTPYNKFKTTTDEFYDEYETMLQDIKQRHELLKRAINKKDIIKEEQISLEELKQRYDALKTLTTLGRNFPNKPIFISQAANALNTLNLKTDELSKLPKTLSAPSSLQDVLEVKSNAYELKANLQSTILEQKQINDLYYKSRKFVLGTKEMIDDIINLLGDDVMSYDLINMTSISFQKDINEFNTYLRQSF